MSHTELQHLITMINQIADNIATTNSAAQTPVSVAEHIKRFWARSMKEQIVQYSEHDGQLLSPVAREAIAMLKAPR